MSEQLQEEVQEETTETQDALQDKLDEVYGSDVKSDEPSDQDAKEEEVDEDSEASEDSTDATAEATYGARELEAARRLGLDAEDLAKLGEKGLVMAQRAAKSHSDTGRVMSEIGRLRKELNPPVKRAELKPLDTEEHGEAGEAHNTLLERLNALQEQVDGFSQHAVDSENAQTEREVSAFFSSLDKELYPQLGEGATVSELSDEYEKRNELRGKAAELMVGYDSTHKEDHQSMTVEQALTEALAIQFPNAKKTAKGNKVKKRAGTKVARPNSGGGAPAQTKEQIAMDKLADWQIRGGHSFLTDVRG